jgi:hypothetical protein
MYIKVKNLIGERCIDVNNGKKLYNTIYPSLERGKTVYLDFNNVFIFSSPFLNFSIGQLLKNITIDNLNRLLKIKNLEKH